MNLESTEQKEEEITLQNIDSFLDKEREKNKTEGWAKINKNMKRQLLHSYAERYGKENKLPIKDIKSLKMFFSGCLEKNKLNRTKDVLYNRDERSIMSIPSLLFNKSNKNFTLKLLDAKRVSTLKSLTPKRHDSFDSTSRHGSFDSTVENS